MTTKKNTLAESQTEIKTSKVESKSTKSSPSTQSLLKPSSSCCSSTSNNSKIYDQHHEEKSPKLLVNSFKTECCKGSLSCDTSDSSTKHEPMWSQKTEIKKGPKTRIIIRYDIGLNNILFIRGKGADLSWDKGIRLKNIKSDEWVWETEALFNTCEFKVLINDHHYEIGENHPLSCGASIQYTPKF